MWLLLFMYCTFQGSKRKTRSTAKATKKKIEAAKDEKAETPVTRVEDNRATAEEEEDVCPICLDPPLHPVELEVCKKLKMAKILHLLLRRLGYPPTFDDFHIT